jgi:hypothetical protein
MQSFKMGLHEARNLKQALTYLKHRYDVDFSGNPQKDDGSGRPIVVGTKPCFYSFSKDNKYCYQKGENGVHYCYGFTGTGFKFLPLHGKIMFDKFFKEKITDTNLNENKESLKMKARL